MFVDVAKIKIKAGDGGDGRKGHNGQRHIGDVVEKRAQECAADGLSDERERQDADKVCNDRRRQDGEERFCHAAASSSAGRGNKTAASAEMTTVRMIVRLPEERSRSAGRKANAALAAKAESTQPSTTRFSFAGGTMMARNMP